MWTTPDKVRSLLGLSVSDVEDRVLNKYIEDAQKEMLRQIALYARGDTLSGNINGTNTTFTTSYAPIADSNFDLVVDKNDITVYGMTDTSDPFSTVSLTVSSIDAYTGKIVMSSAPSSDYEALVAYYYYYPCTIDSNLIPTACAYLAGYKYVLAEYLLIPAQFYHGAYRFKLGEPWTLLRQEYEKLIDLILSYPAVKGTHPLVPIPSYKGSSITVLGGTLSES